MLAQVYSTHATIMPHLYNSTHHKNAICPFGTQVHAGLAAVALSDTTSHICIVLSPQKLRCIYLALKADLSSMVCLSLSRQYPDETVMLTCMLLTCSEWADKVYRADLQCGF